MYIHVHDEHSQDNVKFDSFEIMYYIIKITIVLFGETWSYISETWFIINS